MKPDLSVDLGKGRIVRHDLPLLELEDERDEIEQVLAVTGQGALGEDDKRILADHFQMLDQQFEEMWAGLEA